MNRRGFMEAILATAMAPAVVKVESLMRIKPIIVPGDEEWVRLDEWHPGNLIRKRDIRVTTMLSTERQFPYKVGDIINIHGQGDFTVRSVSDWGVAGMYYGLGQEG